MKKTVLVLVLAIFVASLTSGQIIQQEKAIKSINQKLEQLIELKDLFEQITALSNKLTPANGWAPAGAEKVAIENRLNALNRRLAAQQRAFATSYSSEEAIQKDIELFLGQKKAIEETLITQAVNQTTPKELKCVEKKRRKNSLEVRSGEVQLSKEQLSLEKIKQTPVDANGVMGYKVLIWNQDRRKSGNFKLQDSSGKDVDKGSYYLAPGEKIETYLLPGKYLATVEMTGRLPASTTVEVGINHKFVNGLAYHGYLIQPAR